MKESIEQIVGGVLAATLLLFLKGVRTWLWSMATKVMPNKKEEEHAPVQSAITLGRIIHDKLVELRVRVDAERAYLCQFHNGEKFSTKSPIWRYSCTHETCSSGVTNISCGPHAVTNVLISNVVHTVEALYADVEDDWYSRYQCSECDDCAEGQKISIIIISKLPNSFAKSGFLAHGVKFTVRSPLIIGGQIVGFVAVDFCGKEVTLDDINAKPLEEICKISSRISYEIHLRS